MRLFGFNIPWTTPAALSVKVSDVARLIYQMYSGSREYGAWTGRDFKQYYDDAYRRCAVAYKAVDIIAKAGASIPIHVYRNGKKVDNPQDQLVRLLRRPNPMQGWGSFMESVIAYYRLTGNSYIEGIPAGGSAEPVELWSHRADRMKVVPGPLGVAGFIYMVENAERKRWDANPITGESPILHLRTFNPLNDWYGMSPIEAAAFSVDQFNQAGLWNQGLLQNGARPSGALVYSPGNGAQLTDKQFERLKEEINAQYTGHRNAGRPMILDGGLDWKSIQMSPQEMDWLSGKNTSAREIATVLGCPAQMLSIQGDSTYANFQEARQSLYEDTVIPLMATICDGMSVWLGGPDSRVELRPFTDDIPALAPKRAARWQAVQGASWLTVNEKRIATGYEPIDSPMADEVMAPAGLSPLSAADPADDMEDDAQVGGEPDDVGKAGEKLLSTLLQMKG